jgi:hypothetical protein
MILSLLKTVIGKHWIPAFAGMTVLLEFANRLIVTLTYTVTPTKVGVHRTAADKLR